MHNLKLYVLGETNNSAKLIEDLENILDEHYKDDYHLKVIDLLKFPQLAEKDKIFATPTLIKYLPAPVSKVIGNLNSAENILVGLDLLKDV